MIVLVRNGLNADLDPDPAIYLNADLDPSFDITLKVKFLDFYFFFFQMSIFSLFQQ
jgi:hypothetical protein